MNRAGSVTAPDWGEGSSAVGAGIPATRPFPSPPRTPAPGTRVVSEPCHREGEGTIAHDELAGNTKPGGRVGFAVSSAATHAAYTVAGSSTTIPGAAVESVRKCVRLNVRMVETRWV